MSRLIQLIEKNIEEYPEFNYYSKLFKKAEKNEQDNPDICIELCNALMQGFSKKIITSLATQEFKKNNTFKIEFDSIGDIKKKSKSNKKSNSKSTLDTSELVKPAVYLLKLEDTQIEDDFIHRAVSLFHAIGTLRNARGDISHGKIAPKTIESTPDFAYMVRVNAESILYYMLSSFYTIKEKEKEKEKERTENIRKNTDIECELKNKTILPYSYESEEYEGFNANLDENNPLEDDILYSEILYHYYPEQYRLKHKEYLDFLEEDEEDAA